MFFPIEKLIYYGSPWSCHILFRPILLKQRFSEISVVYWGDQLGFSTLTCQNSNGSWHHATSGISAQLRHFRKPFLLGLAKSSPKHAYLNSLSNTPRHYANSWGPFLCSTLLTGTQFYKLQPCKLSKSPISVTYT